MPYPWHPVTDEYVSGLPRRIGSEATGILDYWDSMTIDGIIAITTTIVVFLTLQIRRRTPTEVVFMGGLTFVILCGVITPEEAFAGFGSNAVLTIGGLLVCAAALRETGVLDWVGERLLGSAVDERSAMIRLWLATLAASAFLLNTAVVVMMMPVVIEWCRRRSVSPSRLLMPLSYFAILGGVCTLIGTSTMLVVNSELQALHGRRSQELQQEVAAHQHVAQDVANDEIDLTTRFVNQLRPLSTFEIGRAGVPCAVAGGLVVLMLSPLLPPKRQDMVEQFDEQRREYLVEMRVQPSCPLIGKTVEAAGLRRLPGLFLIEINRESQEVITPVSPAQVLRANDRLVFSGIVDTIIDLEKITGLVPAADKQYEADPRKRAARNLTEVVLSRSCPLVGASVRDGAFRQHYNAAVVAVHRNGVRLTNKIGDIVLEPGDTLLLQTSQDFVRQYGNRRDFYLVSAVRGSHPRRSHRALAAAMLAMLLVAWLALTSLFRQNSAFVGLSSTAVAAIAIAGLGIVTRCVSAASARDAIDVPLLVTIAGALGLARALHVSGADEVIATTVVQLVGRDPWVLLIVVYGLTMVFTEMITNNAVAATLLPIAVRIAETAGVSPRPFIMAIALAASLSFLTPIGYQTNLMVMGPGGYHVRDYFRTGWPVAVAVAITAILLIPRCWPFAL